MALILDTHVFWWLIAEPSKLVERHRQAIDDRSQPVYVSAVTGWEISIKVKLGKWPQAKPLLPGLATVIADAGLQQLDITLAQAEMAGSLDLIHRDPFDRMLAAQALVLGVPIATVDPKIALFGCAVL